MYDKQRKLTINFRNGLSKTITPIRGGESFLNFSQKERDNISSLRFVLGDQTFTITRKLAGNVGTLEAQGFFYHIMEGRKTIMGKDPGKDNPLLAERIGFCFNGNGNSYAALINYLTGNVEFIQENIIDLGVNVGLFHDMKDRNVIFNTEITEYRKSLLRAEELDEPLKMKPPLIPYLSTNGLAPRVLFNSKDVSTFRPS